MAGTDGRLIRLLGEATGSIQLLDARPAAFVDIDERLPAFDDPDAVNVVEITDLVLRRRDDVPGVVAVVLAGLDGEPVVGPRDLCDGRLVAYHARRLGLFGQQVK